MAVVHAIAARLRPDAQGDAITEAAHAAVALQAAPGVAAAYVGQSSTHLVTAVWLPDTAALEPFAASAQHMTFVMRGLAPVVQGMWSVSISTDREPPSSGVASIWVFAVPEADGVFEWQVRRELETIDAWPGAAWTGPTVEERERNRAGGVVLLTEAELAPFELARAAPADEAPAIESALAPLIGSRSERPASS